MLRELTIENVAVIAHAEIGFSPGLNVLTGETGAGKSIIIDSISAVSGARVSRELVRSGAERAVVTAVFDAGHAADWLLENEIDSEDEQLILQRRITADGKSSCRVNGYPVSAVQMRELGNLLLEIHGQNDGAQLLDERTHLATLDRYADLDVREYRDAYRKLQELLCERESLLSDQEEKEHLQIVLTETVEELERASVRKGEQEELKARRDLLRNAEKLKEALQITREALTSDDGALAHAQLAARQCRRAASFADELNAVSDELEQAYALLGDADESLREFEENLNFSAEDYDRLEQRLHDLSRWERKYRCSADELPDYLESCKNRLNELSFSEERLQQLNGSIRRQEALCYHQADLLHAQRVKAAETLEKQVEKELRDLAMPAARFQVELRSLPELKPEGTDMARFLLSANKGEDPGRISRIASGGELSRIMLALKNTFSRKDPVPTMIFDEIDSGVSGIAAQRVGEKLASLSASKQVLCVTHLPQIAVMADRHCMIEKTDAGDRTETMVHLLARSGRLQELARLNGGENITETTLLSAEEQLRYAENYKARLKGANRNGSI